MKYVAISDAHLGQTGEDGFGQYSLLSNQSRAPSAKTKIYQLYDVIRAFADGDEITLIGVGDMLDLSFSYLRTALIDMIELLRGIPKLSQFVFVVGNHDHHIWTLHSEYENAIYPITEYNELPEYNTIYEPTGPYGEPLYVLENLFQKQLEKEVLITIAYPSYYLNHLNDKFYFTHGHLFGGLYTLTSDILKPFLPENSPYEKMVSTVNVAIIEFIYWLLGEMGEQMGAEGIMEALYFDAQKNKKSLIYKAIDSAVETLLPNGIIRGIPDSWERGIAKWVARHLINNLVKEPKPLSSRDRFRKIEETREFASKWLEKIQQNEIKLVSGHTHRADRFINGNIEIFNLGSWLVEPGEPEPESFALFIDESGAELRKI